MSVITLSVGTIGVIMLSVVEHQMSKYFSLRPAKFYRIPRSVKTIKTWTFVNDNGQNKLGCFRVEQLIVLHSKIRLANVVLAELIF